MLVEQDTGHRTIPRGAKLDHGLALEGEYCRIIGEIEADIVAAQGCLVPHFKLPATDDVEAGGLP